MFNISGKLSALIKDGMTAEQAIDLPILDEEGHQIGKITSVDVENDEFHGEVDNIYYERLYPATPRAMSFLMSKGVV